MSGPRGRCPVCRYSYRLRKDGTVQRHHGYSGRNPLPDCEGTGQAPLPWNPDQCGDCTEYRYMTPGLAEACASVGIEHGKDAGTMMFSVLSAYHHNGHRETA